MWAGGGSGNGAREGAGNRGPPACVATHGGGFVVGRRAAALVLGLALAGCARAATRPATAGAPAAPSAAPAAPATPVAATTSATAPQAPSGEPLTTTSTPVRLHPATSPGPAAVAVRFVDALHGWALAGCTPPQPCDILATADGGRTWTVQLQTDARLTHLQFLNAQAGFATGPTTVLATGDGGARWLVRDTGAARLQSIRFVTADTGWAVSAGGLARSTDGGRHWTEVLRTGACSFSSLSFPDAAEGWAGGQGPGGPCLYDTGDGGKTWGASFTDAQGAPVRSAIAAWAAATSQPAAAVAADMRGGCPVEVDFTGPATGWLSLLCYNAQYTGGRLVLRSTDAGRSWTYAWGLSDCLMGCEAESGDMPGLFFLGGTTAWRLGPGGSGRTALLTIQRSTDGGGTWTRGGVDCRPLGLCQHLDFIRSDRGWMATPDGIFTTGDGGLNWQRQWPAAYGGPFAAVDFTSVERGFAVPLYAQNTIVQTADGGSTWSPLAAFGATTLLTGVDFTDASHGWAWTAAFGAAPALLATSDGGRTWVERALPPMGNVSAVHLGFAGHGNGWLVDGNGEAWSTADGGRHWRALPLSPARSCPLLTTADGGRTWHAAACPADLPGLVPAGDWVAGDGGILHTTNGGQAWSLRPWPGLHPASLQFVDAAHGWLLTRGGTLWKTTDGGHAWVEVG